MSLQGRVVVECDSPQCYGQQHFSCEQAWYFDVESLARHAGWRLVGEAHRPGGWLLCPQCLEQRKELP